MGKTFRAHEDDEHYDDYTEKRLKKEKKKRIESYVEQERHHSDKTKILDEYMKPIVRK